jgi:hypothetical protein
MAIVVEVPPQIEERLIQPGRGRNLTRRCRPVRVLAVDPEVARAHQPPFGKAKAVEVGQVFASAALASEHLGFGCNCLAIKLSQARKAGQTAPQVKLRGVTLACENDGSDKVANQPQGS